MTLLLALAAVGFVWALLAWGGGFGRGFGPALATIIIMIIAIPATCQGLQDRARLERAR